MKITYAGQIDHPALMKLERAEDGRCKEMDDACCEAMEGVQDDFIERMHAPNPVAPTPEPSPPEALKDDGWIAWIGLSRQGPGECIGKTIEVRYRSGIDNQIFTTNGEGALWDHTETNGIIAYRLVEPRK